MTFIIISLILIAISAIYLFLIAPGGKPSKDSLLYAAKYAHRGLHSKDKTIPENSMSAFIQAVEAGYGIELDITITTDNKVVVFHDDTLQRVCGVDKAISDCSYDELIQFRLLDSEEKIPLLSDVLELVDTHVPLVVELKHTKRNRELCEKAAMLLDEYKGAYCIESFDPGIVRWFRKNRPNVVRGQLATSLKDYKSLPLHQGILLSSLLTNCYSRPNFVAYKHQDSHNKLKLNLFRLLGGKLIGWTVRDTDNIEYCEDYFDAIIFEFFTP